MALIHSFEASGNFLFRYRGQIPVILFLLSLPVIFFTDYSEMNELSILMFTVVAVFLSVIGFFIRAFAIATTPKGTSGRNTQHQLAESLNKTGIYSVCRHPLYIGNYFMWIGIVVFTFNIYFIIVVSLAFWLYYERIMFAEERYLEKKFGEEYNEWSLTVPAVIPVFSKYRKSHLPFSYKSLLRREYSGIGATTLGFAFVDVLRIYFNTGIVELQRISIYVFAGALVLAIVLRTLKHSNMLHEENRS